MVSGYTQRPSALPCNPQIYMQPTIVQCTRNHKAFGSQYVAFLPEHSLPGSQHMFGHLERWIPQKNSQATSFYNGISGATESAALGSPPATQSARSSTIRRISTDQCHAHLTVTSHPERSRAIPLALFLAAWAGPPAQPWSWI